MREIIISFLFVSLLTACIPGGMTFSPERAVTQDLITNQNALPDSIRIRQIQPWRNGNIVLVSYLSNQENEEWSCETVYDVSRDTTGWHVTSSGGGCSNPPEKDPFTFGSGMSGIPPSEFSYTYGLLNLEDAEWVEITWEDDFTQRVSIINKSFLALRNGSFPDLAQVQILNIAEEVIYDSEE